MMRTLAMIVLCTGLAACNSGGGVAGAPVAAGGAPAGDAGINPTAIVLDAPPVNNQLPADLLPPA